MRLSRQAKVILCTLQSFNELIDAGYISGVKLPITSSGVAAVKNFNPTQEEIDACFKSMFIPQRGGGFKMTTDLAKDLGFIEAH